MTKIGKMGQVSPAQCKDNTAPPTPQVTRSMAFVRGSASARLQSGSGGNRATGRDPAYFELGNVEVGTKIQMVNLSANPDVQWDDSAKIVDLTLTGRDVKGRAAGIYLSAEQMDKIGLKPGDMLQLRAVDHSGNASAPVTTELEPNDWAGNRVSDTDGVTRGTQFAALDGEATRKNLIVKAVNDSRPPVVLENKLKLTADDKGMVNLQGEMAVEPRSRVRVQNQRTGKVFSGTVGDDRKLNVALGEVKDGDPIILSPTDNEGVVGQDVVLIYSSCSQDGKAAKLNPLAARLPGVL